MNTDNTVLEDERELKGWLLVLNGPWKGRDYRLFVGKTIVGSSHYADIYLPDNRLEPFHFSIRCTPHEVWLTDLDSNAGLFFENKPLFRAQMADECLFSTAGIDFVIKFLETVDTSTLITE